MLVKSEETANSFIFMLKEAVVRTRQTENYHTKKGYEQYILSITRTLPFKNNHSVLDSLDLRELVYIT